MSLWDGRFDGAPDEEMLAFSESLGTDLQMWAEDIEGSVAHATMLAEVGLLEDPERDAIVEGLRTIGEELRSGAWVPTAADEDIHMAVEARLRDRIGAVAGKLHTARSRNDQVATDTRLWLRARLRRLDTELARLIGALLNRVVSDGRTLIPGYTHLQRGQPVWLGHHLLAYAWAFSRDRERVAGALQRTNRCPLGGAAMAGTPFPIDRARTAELLGFDGLVENAMDAVAARDYQIEAVAACAIAASHLSRLSEELVLWSSAEFGFVRLVEGWSTGSSIMPQKRNPDAAELVRGKTGRVYGSLVSLLTLVKALPMAYNRDLQEDRPALFDAVEQTTACVRVTTGCVASLEVLGGPDLRGDGSLATELADALAGRGVPFREAHKAVGRLVKLSEQRDTDLAGLTLDDLRDAHPGFVAEDLARLDPEAAAERRTSRGGTAWSEVERQVELLRETL